MTSVELRRFLRHLEPYQIAKIEAETLRLIQLDAINENQMPDRCPICGGPNANFERRGFQCGKQRYWCRKCGHKFTSSTNMITYKSRQSVTSWVTMLDDTLALKSLDDTQKTLGVSHQTVATMRLKLLGYIEQAIEIVSCWENEQASHDAAVRPNSVANTDHVAVAQGL